MAKDQDRADVFRRNFRGLLRSQWLSQREAADEIGVRYKWIRRLCHHGLIRFDRRTQAKLEQVAEFFGLEADDLWNPNCLKQPKSSSVLVKWTGSKRRQADSILCRFPSEIATYYEPFVGSGAVVYRLLWSGIKVRRLRCSDICRPLIDIWNLVISDPRRLARGYEQMWSELQDGGRNVYYEVRRQFNETGDPCQFFFLLRTCRLGLVRFNKRGQFTTGFHYRKGGMPPELVKAVLADWHDRLSGHDIQFTVRDYRTISSRPGDFLYLDPPYKIERPQVYYGRFDLQPFFAWLAGQQADYALSLNGFVNGTDKTVPVPRALYDEHLQLDSGTNPVRRLNRMGVVPVTDSLYVKR
ncbi:MAG: DNA adenine methylase [Pirellulaceae bacterium]